MQLPYELEKSLKKSVEKHIQSSGAEDEHEIWNLRRLLLNDIIEIVGTHLDKKDCEAKNDSDK